LLAPALTMAISLTYIAKARLYERLRQFDIGSCMFMRCAKAFVPLDGTIGILQKNAKHFPTL